MPVDLNPEVFAAVEAGDVDTLAALGPASLRCAAPPRFDDTNDCSVLVATMPLYGVVGESTGGIEGSPTSGSVCGARTAGRSSRLCPCM